MTQPGSLTPRVALFAAGIAVIVAITSLIAGVRTGAIFGYLSGVFWLGVAVVALNYARKQREAGRA